MLTQLILSFSCQMEGISQYAVSVGPHGGQIQLLFLLIKKAACTGGRTGLAAAQRAAAGSGLQQRGLPLELRQVPGWWRASPESGCGGYPSDSLALLPEGIPDR